MLERTIFGILALLCMLALLYVQPVVPSDQPALSHALALFRIGFGALLCFRLQRLRKALPMLWPSETARGWDKRVSLPWLITIWQVLAVGLILGVYTPVMAALNFAMGLYVFGRARLYSIEEILFQNASFFLIWLDSGRVFSVDSLASLMGGVSEAGRLLAINLFWLSLVGVLFSAGLEKLFSPTWRMGQGFNCFVGMPHFVRPLFHFLRRFPRWGLFLSWLTVIAESSLLVASLWGPARLVATLILLGFAFSLFVVVDISFIGQILSLCLLLFLGLDLAKAFGGGSLHDARGQVLSFNDPLSMAVVVMLVLTLASLLDLRVPFLGGAKALARWTTGLAPIKVFTEQHLEGLYLYRIGVRLKDGRTVEGLPVFTEEGGPGRLQQWYPRIFQGFMYPVTDLCLLYGHRGPEVARASRKFFAIRDLMACALKNVQQSEPTGISEVTLYVRSVECRELTPGVAPLYACSEWVPFVRSGVEQGKLQEPEWQSSPPMVSASSRLTQQLGPAVGGRT